MKIAATDAKSAYKDGSLYLWHMVARHTRTLPRRREDHKRRAGREGRKTRERKDGEKKKHERERACLGKQRAKVNAICC